MDQARSFPCCSPASSSSDADGLQGHSWARDIHGMLSIHEIGQYLMLWRQLEHITLTNQPDNLVWKLNASGIYSASSCYKATFLSSAACNSWKCWAPPRVKFFH
jgi:hypothetical protein